MGTARNVATAAAKIAIAGPTSTAWYKRGVRFWLGLAIGVVVGAVAMYLVVAKPWRSSPTTVAVATPPVGSGSGSGSGAAKKKKGHHRGTGGGGTTDEGAGGDGGGGDNRA